MRRLVGWIGGALGGVTAYRLLRRRPEVAAEPAGDPAAELRAKLAETRAAEPVVEAPVAEAPADEQLPAESVADEAPSEAEPESPEDRRRRIHEEGRAALDEMQPEADADS